MTDDVRPQDVGRRHRKRGTPTAETQTLLAAFRDAQRAELRDVLHELEGVPDPQTTLDGSPPKVKRPNLTQRIKLWDLAIKIAHDLGTEVDVGPAEPTEPADAPRRKRVEY